MDMKRVAVQAAEPLHTAMQKKRRTSHCWAGGTWACHVSFVMPCRGGRAVSWSGKNQGCFEEEDDRNSGAVTLCLRRRDSAAS
eukprot:1160072-Pelagomonas_calceolata.AAC.2